MAAADTYKSIASPSEGLYKELGSRFMAFAYPVESEEEVKAAVAALRKEYHDARHHCYAYRIGLGGTVFRSSDDGEPAGSAGRPIFGVPGLIRAYKTSAADALASAEVVEKVAGAWYRLDFDYSLLPQAMKIIKDLDLPQRAQDFGMQCSMEVRVRLNLEEEFLERTKKIGIFKNQL